MRIKWIDYIKSGSIFLVVMGHAGFPEDIRSIIYVFHIPLFFFLSGMFFNFEKFPNYKTFLKRRFFQLIVPYLFFNAITYLLWVFVGRHFGLDATLNISPFKPLLGILLGNANHLYLEHNVPMWFLACLFTTENLYFLLFRKQNSKTILKMLPIVAVIGFFDYHFNHVVRLPWGINIAIVMLAFYGLGSLLRDKIIGKSFHQSILFAIAVFSFSMVLLIAHFNGKIEVSDHYYGNYLLFWIGAFSGIISAISIAKIIENLRVNLAFLSFIGQNTLIIFALHLTAGSFIKAISVYFFHLPLTIFDPFWGALLYCIISVIILLPVVLLLNKYLPFFVGKKP